MKFMTLPIAASFALLAACSDNAEAPASDGAEAANVATTAAAAPHPDDDAATPVESAEEHGHEHDGDEAEHTH